MTTTFPGAIDSYSTKVDGVDDVLAAHVNDLQDAVVAIETSVISQEPNSNFLQNALTYDIDYTTETADLADGLELTPGWFLLHNGQTPDFEVDTTNNLVDVEARPHITTDSAASQFGLVFFLPYKESIALRGKTLSFSIDVEGSQAVGTPTVRAAIVGWDGAIDGYNNDIVSVWQEGDPDLLTNWAYLNTPASVTCAGEIVRVTVEGVAIPVTPAATLYENLAVFVWTTNEQASGDDYWFSNAKLEIGSPATDFTPHNYSQEKTQITFGDFDTTIDGTLAGNSDTNLPTEQAVKEYVDNVAPVAFSTFTPSITQGVSVSATVTHARYKVVSGICHIEISLAVTGTGTSGQSIVVGNLPQNIKNSGGAASSPIGTGYVFEAGVASHIGFVMVNSTTAVIMRDSNTGSGVGANPAFALGAGDNVNVGINYEVA